MTYSDGTLGCETNICRDDLSSMPECWEIFRYYCVRILCLCLRERMELLCYFYKLTLTPTHTPNHQRAKRNNGEKRWRALQVSRYSLCFSLWPFLVQLCFIIHSVALSSSVCVQLFNRLKAFIYKSQKLKCAKSFLETKQLCLFIVSPAAFNSLRVWKSENDP